VVWYSPVTGAGNRVYSNESNTNEVVTATEEASSVATGFPVFATALPFTNLEAHWTADAEL
ncbi:MAG: hypothetical protein R3E96_16015, partial [Planctomycetota bacterium]